jgi:hypothetical protein
VACLREVVFVVLKGEVQDMLATRWAEDIEYELLLRGVEREKIAAIKERLKKEMENVCIAGAATNWCPAVIIEVCKLRTRSLVNVMLLRIDIGSRNFVATHHIETCWGDA